jgi:hypothetical protein
MGIVYLSYMARRPISITLDVDNLIWLKGRADAEKESVSEVVDQIVTAARDSGSRSGPARSVVGTIDVDSSDPMLERADGAIRTAFDASLGRPLASREDRHRRGPATRRPVRKTTRG